MGNSNGKSGADALFKGDELKVLEATFRQVCKSGDKLTEEHFLSAWHNDLDKCLLKCIANYLFQNDNQRLSSIQFKRFVEPLYIVKHGTISEKVEFLLASMARGQDLSSKELEYYISSLVKSYLNMETLTSSDLYHKWKENGYQATERTVSSLAKGLIRSLASETKIAVNSLERWMHTHPSFVEIWKEVFAYVYSGRNHAKIQQLLGAQQAMHLLPRCDDLMKEQHYSPILELPQIMFINGQLPTEHRHRWRFLFSSKIMGQSFSTMLGKLTNRGATIIIVEDEDHYIFGGFAPDPWALGPNFVGNDTAMLFTLSPAMRAFSATSYNDHYQYLNINQQTMPNGLGMGGQFNYWGLWLDCDYGNGQSVESCSTFQGYCQLSKRKEFRIRNLEVWGVGDLPVKDDDDEPHRSVLDRNLEDQVMLELAGKKMYSEGLREEPE